MSLFIASINSGSNGNCYYVGNDKDAVLVDAGLSCKEIERRMRTLGLSMSNVRAIFISHEHGDHIKGLTGLCAKYALPVYITSQTYKHSKLVLQQHLLIPFLAEVPVNINGLTITPFSKKHDAIDAHSFIVQGNDVTIGVFTDLGICCDNLVRYFKQCHAAFLEANYDAGMLANGRYPIYLKNRIRGGMGHISNDEAVALFNTHRPPHMSHVLLAHLSKDNNDPQIASDLFHRHANGVQVTIASRYEPTGVFTVNSNGIRVPIPQPRPRVMQASLF